MYNHSKFGIKDFSKFSTKNISRNKIICIFARYIYVYEGNEENNNNYSYARHSTAIAIV